MIVEGIVRKTRTICSIVVLGLLLGIGCGTENSGLSSTDTPTQNHDIKKGPEVPPIPDVFVIQDIPIYDPLSEYTDEYWDACIFTGLLILIS